MNQNSGSTHSNRAEPALAPHSRTAKILHWGFILVFAYGLAKQLDEVELEDFALLQNEMLFASVFLFVLFARFAYMRYATNCITQNHRPAYPALGPCRASGDVRKFGAYCRFGVVHRRVVLVWHKN